MNCMIGVSSQILSYDRVIVFILVFTKLDHILLLFNAKLIILSILYSVYVISVQLQQNIRFGSEAVILNLRITTNGWTDTHFTTQVSHTFSIELTQSYQDIKQIKVNQFECILAKHFTILYINCNTMQMYSVFIRLNFICKSSHCITVFMCFSKQINQDQLINISDVIIHKFRETVKQGLRLGWALIAVTFESSILRSVYDCSSNGCIFKTQSDRQTMIRGLPSE